jgi:hypothetical protein
VKCAWMCNFNYGILYFHNGVLGSEKKVWREKKVRESIRREK